LSFKNIIEFPKIIKHPQSLQVTEGNTARFTSKAAGEQISYQWQKNNIDISGANDTVFELRSLSIGDSAIFRCIASNSAGSDTSKNATLKIFINELVPKITKQPETQRIEVGDTARFSIVSGGTNLKYQWYKDNEKIDNAVLAIFETGPVSSEDSGKIFHCIVYNDEGQEISNKVTLMVKSIAKPEIKEHPKISKSLREKA
jgi:hypothetical protein